MIFPGFVEKFRLEREEGAMQDTVYCQAGCGLDLYGNGGHLKVLIGGDMYLDMCLLGFCLEDGLERMGVEAGALPEACVLIRAWRRMLP